MLFLKYVSVRFVEIMLENFASKERFVIVNARLKKWLSNVDISSKFTTKCPMSGEENGNVIFKVIAQNSKSQDV